jgi:hypothetical protein
MVRLQGGCLSNSAISPNENGARPRCRTVHRRCFADSRIHWLPRRAILYLVNWCAERDLHPRWSIAALQIKSLDQSLLWVPAHKNGARAEDRTRDSGMADRHVAVTPHTHWKLSPAGFGRRLALRKSDRERELRSRIKNRRLFEQNGRLDGIRTRIPQLEGPGSCAVRRQGVIRAGAVTSQ